jgi:hypothetical protein
LLLRKYTPGQVDATIFLPPQYITETLLLAGRVNRFPISEPSEDSLLNRTLNRILVYPDGLKIHDVIILAEDPNIFNDNTPFNAMQIKLINRLCQEFSFEEIEHTPSGVLAVRLGKYVGNPTAYCVTMKSLVTP